MTRMSKRERDRARFVRNIHRTLPNKIYATALMVLGWWSAKYTGDATALVLISFIAVPAFFSHEQMFY